MKAVICTRYGPPEVLRLAEVERPTPRRNQIRIRIFATAVTVSDCVIRGLRAPRRYRLLLRLLAGWNAPRRPILGMVLAGEVESVGRNVTSFKEGDQVFGMSRWVVGAYAEEVCWPANTLLAHRPTNLCYEEAAALPYGGLLAMQDLLKRLAESGALKPVIDRRYRLEEIVEAHRYVELGHKKGNVIVTVGPPRPPR
jgi:NADPH:quinone reductase-like Zn-dependent oxidoreductase